VPKVIEAPAAPSPIAPVLVTGATGNVGREVVKSLQALGIPFVAAGSDPERVRKLLGGQVQAVRLDFRDPPSWPAAVRGMRGLFLMRPPAIANVGETLNAFLDVALQAGVEHVAFLSVDGADRQRWVPHHAVEAHLAARGASATLLRAGFFAQNLGDAYREDLKERNELYVPAGAGRVAFVDVRDVAELAARSFVEAELRGQGWTLTGPEALTFAQVAEILGQESGRPIRYRPASVIGSFLHLRRQGKPWGQALVQTLLHVGLRMGNAETVDPTLARLLGRPARTLREYVRERWLDRPDVGPEDVLAWWFGPGADPWTVDAAHAQRWFTRSEATDAEIRSRFFDTWQAAANGRLAFWDRDARGRLALILALDQFSRNLFRHDPRAFSQDPQALALAVDGIRLGHDQQVPPAWRAFCYLPFEHAEDLGAQARAVRLFDALLAAAPADQSQRAAMQRDYAVRHREVIAEFGRFPHRNMALGRESTPAEQAWLAAGGGF
jgi:uncharacterized protein (DUF924 family)/uncharacterized protein YbjT (DUF2867 family)